MINDYLSGEFEVTAFNDGKMCIRDSIVSVFEEMCNMPLKEDMILFETGTYSFTGKPMFNFSLVRQFPNDEIGRAHV